MRVGQGELDGSLAISVSVHISADGEFGTVVVITVLLVDASVVPRLHVHRVGFDAVRIPVTLSPMVIFSVRRVLLRCTER